MNYEFQMNEFHINLLENVVILFRWGFANSSLINIQDFILALAINI